VAAEYSPPFSAAVNWHKDISPAMTDTFSPPPEPSPPPFRPLAELVHALRFLTRLPVPLSRTLDPPPLHQTMRMFSTAGALIGLLSGGMLWLSTQLDVPSLLGCTIAVAATVMLTGALHEDGLADFVDGLGGGKTREQRLDIMRDSRIGAYGSLALILAVLIRVFTYESLLSQEWNILLLAIAASQSFSRALVVDLMWATPPARSDGLAAMAGRPSRSVAIFAIVIGLAITMSTAIFAGPESAVVALGMGLAATALVRRFALRLLGGQTGDVCGAAQVACELAMLVAFAATLG
jgi:adenosylcobinamide-GDP ribazoletransferase